MIATQTFDSFPEFGNTATKTKPEDAKYSAGMQEADVLPAEWLNWFWSHSSKGVTDLNTGLLAVEQELNAILTAGGEVPSGTSGQVLTAIQYLIQAKTGDLVNLQTTTKTNIVAAVNEILSALNSHKNNTSNPHGVTKEQVGLGNVPNVAPSETASLSSTAPIQTKVATGIANGVICTTAAGTQNKEATINGFALVSGAVVRVLFQNENTASAPTLNINGTGAKAIKAVKAGEKITPPLHTGKWRGADTATEEMWQPYTTLELIYDGTDWVIMGNPEFENWSSATESYVVYSNGLIKQRIRTVTTIDGYVWVSLSIPYSNTDYFVMSMSHEVTTDSDDYEAFAGIHRNTPTGYTTAKSSGGFSIRTYRLARYRDSLTWGY